MTLLTVILLAALTCDMDHGDFFVLPGFATNGIPSNVIPGSGPLTNAELRLKDTTAAACYGTTEAYLERKCYPIMSNYGGGRGKELADLATNDFGNGSSVALYQNNNWIGTVNSFPNFLKPGRNRDFSSTNYVASTFKLTGVGGRLNLANSLFENIVVEGFKSELGLNPMEDNGLKPYEWLDPRVEHENLITDGQYLDNQISTANWTKFLLCIGELERDGLFDQDSTPFPSRLIPLVEWDDNITGLSGYMDEGYFRDIDELSEEISDNRDDRSSLRQGRGTLKSLLEEVTGCEDFAPYEASVTNPLKRLSWKRYATANACMAACSVLYDDMIPNEQYFWDAQHLNLYENPNGRHGARMRSKHKVLTGGFTIRSEYRINPYEHGGIEQSGNITNEACELVVPFSYWSGGNSRRILDTLNITNEILEASARSAWTDVDPNIRLFICLTNQIQAIDFVYEDISSFGVTPGLYSMRFQTRIDATSSSGDFGTYSTHILLVDDVGYEIEIASFTDSRDHQKRWGGSMTTTYKADVFGTQFNEMVTDLKGPTVFDDFSLAGKGYANDYSIAPMPLAEMILESKNGKGPVLAKSIMFDKMTVGVSTNESIITGVAGGEEFNFDGWPTSRYYPGLGYREKDTWAYFKLIKVADQINTYQKHKDACLNVYNSSMNVSSPGGGYEEPDLSIATNPESQLFSITKKAYDDLVFSFGGDDTYDTDIMVYYCGESGDPDEAPYSRLYFIDPDGNVMGDGDTLVTETFTHDEAVTCKKRQSYAKGVFHRPFMLHYFNFPKMRPKTNED